MLETKCMVTKYVDDNNKMLETVSTILVTNIQKTSTKSIQSPTTTNRRQFLVTNITSPNVHGRTNHGRIYQSGTLPNFSISSLSSDIKSIDFCLSYSFAFISEKASLTLIG